MKFYLALLIAIFSGLFSPSTFATSLSQGTIEQPVNLGAQADPTSIPLGPVAWESNYSYGVHTLITASRPCQHGTMEWKRGSELEQNLAYAFGITLDLNGGLTLMEEPITIHIKAWDKPAYSPYSKEQVLAATLHCALRNVRATHKRPLIININAQNPKDQLWAKKYARQYVTAAAKDERNFTPTPITGTQLKIDHFGVTHVIFTNIDQNNNSLQTPNPVLIPFALMGEEESEADWILLPIWTGSTWKKPLDAIGRPYNLFYDLFNPSEPKPEVNSLFSNGVHLRWGIGEKADKTLASLDFDQIDQENLAAALYAIIFSVQPTEKKPLQITLCPRSNSPFYLAPYLRSQGWQKTTYGRDQAVRCEFVLDPKNHRLIKGSVPFVKVLPGKKYTLRMVRDPAQLKKQSIPPQTLSSYRSSFTSNIQRKRYDPTEEELLHNYLKPDQRKGVRWDFWLAGYRDAVAAYIDPDMLTTPPLTMGNHANHSFSRMRHVGWIAGNKRGFDEGVKLMKKTRAQQDNR